MPLYHLNRLSGEPEVCEAMLSCPHGDLEEDHFETVEEAAHPEGISPELVTTLAIQRGVAAASSTLQEWEQIGPNSSLRVSEVRQQLALLSYQLGVAAGGGSGAAEAWLRARNFAVAASQKLKDFAEFLPLEQRPTALTLADELWTMAQACEKQAKARA